MRAAGPRVRDLPGDLGAVEVLDPETRDDPAWLRDLLWRHAVVCLRFGRRLEDDELRAIASMIGSGSADRPELAAATLLHLRQGSSGDTCFIDMRAAYDLLDIDQQLQLVGFLAVHASDVAHPVVRAHPVTGRPALSFDLDRATHVQGLPDEDGRQLLQYLQDHAEQRAPRYCHEWRPGDVLIWDNASVQHRVGEPHRFWRSMVAGPAPVAYRVEPPRAASEGGSFQSR